MFSDDFVTSLKPKLGLLRKQELMTFLGLSMGGVLFALQAVIAHRRSKAMENNVGEQIEANKHVEEGLLQARLRDAIGHLGNMSESVRLGGAYELFHLANDNDNLRNSVLSILCAHIRATTRAKKYRSQYACKPSEEIQSLLELVFVRNPEVFDGLFRDLGGSWLNGAYLRRARLDNAWLKDAYLRGANLIEAVLTGANLMDAQLQGAYLVDTRLDGAKLWSAHLQAATLENARMRGTDLTDADLQYADLSHATMQAARLDRTRMQAARFEETQMQGVHRSDRTGLIQTIRQHVGKESDCETVIFAGKVEENEVDDMLEGVPELHKDLLRFALLPHVGKRASNIPPSGVVTGRYTNKKAEEWIKNV